MALAAGQFTRFLCRHWWMVAWMLADWDITATAHWLLCRWIPLLTRCYNCFGDSVQWTWLSRWLSIDWCRDCWFNCDIYSVVMARMSTSLLTLVIPTIQSHYRLLIDYWILFIISLEHIISFRMEFSWLL